MVGVGKVMLAADSDREGEDSGSNLQIESSWATRAATSSSSLGVPQCLRARAICPISSIWLMYTSPRSMLLHTLVIAETMAWFVAGLSAKGTVACILPSGVQTAWTGELVRRNAGAGGAMFSWSESLGSLESGLSGCGKSSSLTWMKRTGGTYMSIGPVVAFVVVWRGGMGSGVIFSLFPKGSSARVEASDMWLEVRVGGRVEKG